MKKGSIEEDNKESDEEDSKLAPAAGLAISPSAANGIIARHPAMLLYYYSSQRPFPCESLDDSLALCILSAYLHKLLDSGYLLRTDIISIVPPAKSSKFDKTLYEKLSKEGMERGKVDSYLRENKEGALEYMREISATSAEKLQAFADWFGIRIVYYNESGVRGKVSTKTAPARLLGPKIEILIDNAKKCCFELCRREDHCVSKEGGLEDCKDPIVNLILKKGEKASHGSMYCKLILDEYKKRADEFQKLCSQVARIKEENKAVDKDLEELRDNEIVKKEAAELDRKLERSELVVQGFNSAIRADPILGALAEIEVKEEKLEELVAECFIRALPSEAPAGKEERKDGGWVLGKRCKNCNKKCPKAKVFKRFTTCGEDCKIMLCQECLKQRLDKLKEGGAMITTCFSCYEDVSEKECEQVLAGCENKQKAMIVNWSR